MSDAEFVLEGLGISRRFASGPAWLQVLRGVDLRVRRAEKVAVVGPSGSGKSTLLHCLGALDRPDEGTVRIRDRDVSRCSDRELARLRNREIGFVFQFHHLLSALNAVENVAMPLVIAARRRQSDMLERARAVLGEVGLADRAEEKTNRLSGGQQQRVAIARALVTEPPLVLADEPTGNLDTRTADEIYDLMWRFNRERGITFLIVTHDARLAERADRVLELVDGRITRDQLR